MQVGPGDGKGGGSEPRGLRQPALPDQGGWVLEGQVQGMRPPVHIKVR